MTKGARKREREREMKKITDHREERK